MLSWNLPECSQDSDCLLFKFMLSNLCCSDPSQVCVKQLQAAFLQSGWCEAEKALFDSMSGEAAFNSSRACLYACMHMHGQACKDPSITWVGGQDFCQGVKLFVMRSFRSFRGLHTGLYRASDKPGSAHTRCAGLWGLRGTLCGLHY